MSTRVVVGRYSGPLSVDPSASLYDVLEAASVLGIQLRARPSEPPKTRERAPRPSPVPATR